MRSALGLAALGIAGCAVPANVGRTCPRVVVNEIMTANDRFDVGVGHDGWPHGAYDWLELYNDSDDDVDLTGYRLAHAQNVFAFPEDERSSIPADGYLFVLAATYEIDDVEPFILGFDFNNDSDYVDLLGPVDVDGLDDDFCRTVFVPDQHSNFAWAQWPDGSDHWCAEVTPTPGEMNKPCLCPNSFDC